MTEPTTAASDGVVLVKHFYRGLALDRVEHARTVLSAESVEQALSQSAEAFERAAAAIEHARTIAPASGELAQRLAEQSEALMCMAARFEQSADLARHIASGQPARA
jgi:hypothetical protein